MKTSCLFSILLILTLHVACAEIKNGYEKEIESVRRSLRGLSNLIQSDRGSAVSEKQKIRDKITSLVDFICYYEITRKLLDEFRAIAPELYNEIDNIKDNNGRITDVYVKFFPKEQASIAAGGITSLRQSPNNEHTYVSEYGEGTVSVRIWIINKSLWVLAHEFGHVKYQVPNLDTYNRFYKNNYLTRAYEANHIGHNPNDPSGQAAMSFEKQFREQYVSRLRIGYKSESPVVAMENLRKLLINSALF